MVENKVAPALIRKPFRIPLEEFPTYLEKQLLSKFHTGLQGLKDRFHSLMSTFKDLLKDSLDIFTLVSTPMHQGKALTGYQQEAC
jgi:hypothetical protein